MLDPFSNPITKQSYQEKTYTIAANQDIHLDIQARSLFILEVSGGPIEMRVDDGPLSPVRENAGFELPGEATYRRLSFTNTGGTTASFTLVHSLATLKNMRVSLGDTLTTKSGDTLSTPAAVTCGTAATAIVAASSTRGAVMIQNQHTTENVWVGDANVGNDAAPRGMKITAGQSITLASGAALYGRRGNATDVDVTVLEVIA